MISSTITRSWIASCTQHATLWKYQHSPCPTRPSSRQMAPHRTSCWERTLNEPGPSTCKTSLTKSKRNSSVLTTSLNEHSWINTNTKLRKFLTNSSKVSKPTYRKIGGTFWDSLSGPRKAETKNSANCTANRRTNLACTNLISKRWSKWTTAWRPSWDSRPLTCPRAINPITTVFSKV